MKLNLLLMMALPIAMYAQESSILENSETYPNTFSSGSANVQKFDNQARRLNDWSISIGGGPAFMTFSDLTSFYGKDINWGWNAYASLDKQISHTFGVSLQYQMGKTNQKGQLSGHYGELAGVADAWTKFKQISILGDINFSNLLRRVDNHSPYRWALHGYAGLGIQSYQTLLLDQNASRWNTNPPRVPIEIDQDFAVGSFFYQGGLGLKYNVSKLIDVELRAMYIKSGDDEFDGGGDLSRDDVPASIAYNLINDSRSDDMFTVNLGLSFKLGKHDTHLAWYDPLQEVYYRTHNLETQEPDFVVCEKGDLDNDGVCDDWDRELDTPAGARVDGAGVALDMDLDGLDSRA